VGGENAELISVFSDGASGNFNPFGLELFFDGGVRERFIGWFAGDELLDGFADAGVGNFLAFFRGVTRGKKRSELHDAVGGEDIFSSDGPRNGGRVHADDFRDVEHRHRAEFASTVEEEIGLLLDEFAPDFEKRFLSLADGADDLSSFVDVFAEVFAGFGIGVEFGE